MKATQSGLQTTEKYIVEFWKRLDFRVSYDPENSVGSQDCFTRDTKWRSMCERSPSSGWFVVLVSAKLRDNSVYKLISVLKGE